MNPGCFITLEGIEGVGKSTQSRFIVDWLQKHGKTVVATREPGGTPAAEAMRAILLQHWDETITPETELLLLFAGRSQHVTHVIHPALQRGDWVVCDRFTDASYAYQGYARGVSREWIAALEREVQHGLQPDITFLLDAPVVIGSERAKARNQQTDRFEAEKHSFFEKVRLGYLALAEAQSYRFRVIDASFSQEHVQQEIEQHLWAMIT